MDAGMIIPFPRTYQPPFKVIGYPLNLAIIGKVKDKLNNISYALQLNKML